MPALRGRDQLLGAGGDREGPGRDLGDRRSGHGLVQARSGDHRARSADEGLDQGPPRSARGSGDDDRTAPAGGGVHRMATLPGADRSDRSDGARDRGPALGRRCVRRVPGAPHRAHRRTAAARRRHRPSRGRGAPPLLAPGETLHGALALPAHRRRCRDPHHPEPARRPTPS